MHGVVHGVEDGVVVSVEDKKYLYHLRPAIAISIEYFIGFYINHFFTMVNSYLIPWINRFCPRSFIYIYTNSIIKYNHLRN